MDARGRVTAAPLGSAMVVGLAAVLDADARPADWTIEIWSPVHAQRPGTNGGPNLSARKPCPTARPAPAEINDVADGPAAAPPATRVALYDLPQHKLVHHLLPQVRFAPRPCAARRLRERLRDRVLHGRAGRARRRGPRRLSALAHSDPRARRVIETAAAMGGWSVPDATGEGRARRLRLCPLQEPRRLSRRWSPRSRSTREVRARPGMVRRRRRPRHQSGRRRQPDRGRHHPGARAGRSRSSVRFEDGRVASAYLGGLPDLAVLGSTGGRHPASSRRRMSRRSAWEKRRSAPPRRRSAMPSRARSARAFAPCH